jgi:hypothetical protein
MVHQFNPDAAPDSEFEAGSLEHLVVGNRGRSLDDRRTPISVVGVDAETGQFHARIEDFEDKGAIWEERFEKVGNYQFEKGGRKAAPSDVATYEETIRRLDRPLVVPCDRERRKAVERELLADEREAARWLRESSEFLASGAALDTSSERGSPSLWGDLQRFLGERELGDMEKEFAARFVSNPYSGELVKGHRIVMAEMGLVECRDTVVRDPRLFEGTWSKDRRSRHITLRMAFVRALFRSVGVERVTLYRGLSFEGAPEEKRNETFVSASFRFEVARSCFGPRDLSRTGLLMRQSVPVERLFMTYLETEEMNRQFLESEAILLYSEGKEVF